MKKKKRICGAIGCNREPFHKKDMCRRCIRRKEYAKKKGFDSWEEWQEYRKWSKSLGKGYGRLGRLNKDRKKRGYKPKSRRTKDLKLLDALDLKPQTVKEICEKAGLKRYVDTSGRELYDLLNSLTVLGILIREGKGRLGHLYTYKINPMSEYKCIMDGFYKNGGMSK